MTLGLYVHIPFCRHKCLYCDFPSYAGLERYCQGYVEAPMPGHRGLALCRARG